ncbi:MAG: hypothetical protein ACE5GB_09075 [Acidimicrobiales bacterium]
METKLLPGDIQLVNKHHVLHGRRSYIDDPAAGQIRWLKRLWPATDVLGAEDRPDRFQAAVATRHWGERRTRA